MKHDEESSFGLLHAKIVSLNAHIDDLKTVGWLKPEIEIVGISEHEINENTTLSNNINIGG